MLIRITVENFKSFDDSTEFSMVSSSKIQKKPNHVTRANGAKLLRFAALYGANAAGKTNLVDALRFMQQTLRVGMPLSAGKQYCRCSKANQTRETSFELQFSVGDDVFAYGLSAVLSKRILTEEWLYKLGQKKAKCIFLRKAGEKGGISTSLSLRREDANRFRTYSVDFERNETSLFLTEMNRSKQFDKSSPLCHFKTAYEWLTQRLVIMAPMEAFPNVDYSFREDMLNEVSDLVHSFDTGIDEVTVREVSQEELSDKVPREVLTQIREDVRSAFNAGDVTKVEGSIRGNGNLFSVRFSPDGTFVALEIQLRHQGTESIFSYGEESDGTQRLLDILNVLLETRNDVTFVMDELERSLHPMLVRRFLELFEARAVGIRSQLIFSTHESSIMDQSLFRRDEVWFLDRSQFGVSRIYSLDRFKERYDKDIAKAYLEGRYGAIPLFSNAFLTEGGESDGTDS